jgi:alginate O-acetyltransferase complex protein AlgI
VLFNSEPYLLFLPMALGVNWILPAKARPLWLLGASYFFYGFWSRPFLLLIIGLTVANYVIGLVQGAQLPRRRALLIAALVANLGALAVFKYLGLLDQTARGLAAFVGLQNALPVVHIILPLGLSFFTFEFIHYQVDLYRGDRPIHNPINFALFPAFFPTQIAGPIKRYQDFNRQVEARPAFDPVLALEGVELIVRGLVKKVVFADSLIPIVGMVYGHLSQATMVDAWAAAVGFYLQVYFDFSGYTDIGRGSAQLLGYRIPPNFAAPFLATSFQDFWRRWHMSLSFWLRDYLYFPLGGSRKGPRRTRFNLMITMALGGLWHGAAWHFMGMGIVFGLGLNVDRGLQARRWFRPAVPRWTRLLAGWAIAQATFLIGIILFRAPSVQAAAQMVWRMLTGSPHHHLVTTLQMIEVVGLAAGLLGIQLLLTRWRPAEILSVARRGIVLRPAYVMAMALLFTYFFGLEHASRSFVYFQF